MIEFIPKIPQQYPTSTHIAFFISLSLLAGSFVTIFALIYFTSQTQAELGRVETALVTISDEESKLAQEIFLWEQKIKDFAMLVEERQNPLSPFEFLQANTHPKVSFESFEFNASKGMARLEGSVQDFKTLEEQMMWWEGKSEIKTLNLSRLGLGTKGNVVFTLEMTISFP